MTNPSIWTPGQAVSAESSNRVQTFIASAGQTNFTITNFTYEVGTNSLEVDVSGVNQRPGIDFIETGSNSFSLTSPIEEVGTSVFVRGLVDVHGNPQVVSDASNVSYMTETVKTALDARLPEIGTYALLRAYVGTVTAFFVRGVANVFDGGFGVFRVDAADTTTADNGGTVLVDASGRRWKRDFAGAVNPLWFGAKADSGLTDNYQPFRDSILTGLPVEVPAAAGYYGTSKAIVTTSDTYVHLTGIGMPEIKLTGALSTTDMNANCMARMSSSATTWTIRNFRFTGNWDGVAAHPGQPGAGILTAPAENCIPFIDNVECNDFSDYGISFYSVRAAAGKIMGHRNRYQGVAVTNVRDGLTIDEIVANDNGMFGLDIEWSMGSSQMRTIGLHNISIGDVFASGNGYGGIAVSSGGGTNADLAARGLTTDDFDVTIGRVFTANNGADSAFEAGVLIDIPNCEIDAVDSDSDSSGLLVRTTHDIDKTKVIVGDVKTLNAVYNGVYIAGRASYEYKTVRIGSIDTRNNTQRGIYVDSTGFAQSMTIGEIVADSGNGIASTIQSKVRVLKGIWQGASYTIPMVRTLNIPIPTLAAGESVTCPLPSDASWREIQIAVITVDATNPRLRIRVKNTKAYIRGGTAAVRTVGLTANALAAVDTNTEPLGLDAYGGYTLTLQAAEAITAGTFTVLATQVLP